MRPIGMLIGGTVGLIVLVIAAAKAKAATPADSTPTKPTGSTGTTVPISGLPPDVAKIVNEALASKDPVVIRDAAFQIADKYALQAANLLAIATNLERKPAVKT